MKLQTLQLLLLTLILQLVACSPKMQQYTFVMVPDTQTYSEKYPEILEAQTNWIEKQAGKIDLVLQQGDLTQNNSDEEWELVQRAFSKLDGKVPYVLAVGNHDMGSVAGKFADTRNTTLFNKYFPYSHMSGLPAFAGVYEEQKLDNAYYLLETGKLKWLVLTLEFGPRNAVLDWANQVVAAYPDRTVILNTHSYMFSDSTRQNDKDWWQPQAYGIGKDTGHAAVNNGEQVWLKLVKKHSNIRFVFSGHVLKSGVGTLVSINEAGYPVYQFLANYQEGVQGSEKGGNGYLRVMQIDPKNHTLTMKTYSPYLKEYKEEEAHSFKIKNAFLKPGSKD